MYGDISLEVTWPSGEYAEYISSGAFEIMASHGTSSSYMPSGLLTQYLMYMVYTPSRHGIGELYHSNQGSSLTRACD